MQAIRFGAFTPAQQAQLDALTGGKKLKDAVLGSFQPAATSEEKKVFQWHLAEFIRELQADVSRMTPQEFEEGVVNEWVPHIQEGFQAVQQTSNSAVDRENQIGMAVYVGSLVDVAKRWKKPVTDKAFEGLIQLVDTLKSTLKF